MNIIDYIIADVSELPWIVKGPGFILIVIFLLRAVTRVFTLRWIKAITNVVYAVIVILAMARFGQQIADFIEAKQTEPIEQIQQN